MNFREMYPTDRFYAADMRGRPWTLTFADPAVTRKTDEGGEVDPKMPPIWHFVETKKVFPAVKTNGVCARAMFGDESDDWAGHKITLYPAEDTSGLSEDGLCVRVKGSPELKQAIVFRAKIGRTQKKFRLVPTPNSKTKAAAAAIDSADSADYWPEDAPETPQDARSGDAAANEGSDPYEASGDGSGEKPLTETETDDTPGMDAAALKARHETWKRPKKAQEGLL
jgi:hypothetical protein